MRFDLDTYREIADSLVRNRSRSLLTGFGIFWGLFMLLFLIGGGAGLKEMLMNNFEGFATNSVFLVSSNTTKAYRGFKENRYWSLDLRDIDRLKNMIPELDVVSPTMARWGQTAVFGINSVSCVIKGVLPDYRLIETPQLKYGRYINSTDIAQERKVCIIGKRIYTSLFPEGGDPCGSFIRVGDIYFQVVGVDFNSGNINIQGRADEAVVTALPIVQKLYKRGQTVDVIGATARNGVKASSLETRIREVMARQHYFDPTDKPALFVLNTEQIFSIMDNLFRGVNFLVWLVGLGTILAGAIGVSNIMMVTVRERTTEIGIRRAIGATPAGILSQIIEESIALTIVAGSGGIVFSVLLLNALEAVTKHQASFQINFSTAVIATLLLVVLGAAAGMAPASRAMKIKPVDAMRDE